MTIINFITENERIYAKDENDKIIAEITFPTKDGVATINHTFVDDRLRGQGVADKLMRAACEKIKSDGNRVSATCSYAVPWLDKHAEYKNER